MRNILHLCESSDTGGAESVLVSIVENLPRDRYRSIACLLSDGWLKTQLEKRGIETVVIPQPRSFDTVWLLRVYQFLRDRRIDVMHSHEFATNVYASLLSKVTGIPVVATTHGKNYYGDRWRRRAAYRFVARESYMVAVSNDLRKYLVQKVGISERRISVVHNGIDLRCYAAKSINQATRRSLRIDAGRPVIGTVGNLFAVKGQTYLLKACKEIAAALSDVMLLVAGEGDELAPLESEAVDLGIAHNVTFLGFRSDVASLLEAVDVFVLPSLSEGLPLSVLEALAMQKPVVATNVGGIPEIIEDGVTGYLVPPRDPGALTAKVLFLLRHPEVGASFGKAGRQRVIEAFSLEKMMQEYESLYEQSRSGCRFVAKQ